MSGQAQVLAILRQMTPRRAAFPKVRVGSLGDGGYVLPDDLSGIAHVISIGIGQEVSFDLEFAQRGAAIYQYDPTVEGPPVAHERFAFRKIGWGSEEGPASTSLASIIRDNKLSGRNDLLLKFDVEGAEWQSMSGVTTELLKQCRIIACELHGLHNLHHPVFFERARLLMDLLTANHTTVHLHANNCCGVSVVEGVPVPAVVELTLLRNDRSSFAPSNEPIPGPLDYPNMSDRPDLVLNPFLPPTA